MKEIFLNFKIKLNGFNLMNFQYKILIKINFKIMK